MGLPDCQYPLLSRSGNALVQIASQGGQTIPSPGLYALGRAPSGAFFGPAISTLSPVQVTYLDRFRHKVMLRNTALTFNDFWGRVILHETLADECVLDAVLSLGALDQAWDQDKATHKSSSIGRPRRRNQAVFDYSSPSPSLSSSSLCYREAVRHYSQSVRTLHNRLRVVSASGSSQRVAELQRLVPILTMLYCLFEWLHGDENAHDRLLANGLSMAMGDEPPPRMLVDSPGCGSAGVVGDACDTAFGTSAAGYLEKPEDARSLIVRWIILSWIQWPAPFTSAAAVARYYAMHVGRGRNVVDLTSLPAAPATLADDDYEVTCGMFMKVVTLVTLWFVCLRAEGVGEAIMAAVAGVEGPVLDRLRDEQHSLENWVQAWKATLSTRAAAEADAMGRMLLTEMVFGCETLRFMIQVGVPPREGAAARSVPTAHRIMDEVERRVGVKSVLGEVGLGECGPTALTLVCRECRDMAVRARALTVCRWASKARALWDEKGSIMGSCALAALEEKSRDAATGEIPRESQWQWVRAAWAGGHGLLDVTFRSVTADSAGRFQYKTSRLATADFGFGPS
ncbi:hypothetical protein Micbo1qcDRAFT_161583 [Microdochium bolleyi]|uniref:Uncharacterized protein n=1 Tax=Microdochium bolleyi TaxID=196109 RepID=A0A136J8T0_9PEZI|nr:hypothetical protein Micbo1qcDRAFT_161583 [Microdochium bolleyi]